MPLPESAVGRQVKRQHQTAEPDPSGPAHPSRVKKRQQVPSDEVRLIRYLVGMRPQPVLERCEGTDPTGPLDAHPSQHSRDVDPRHPPPHEHAAKEDEHHEAEVDDDDKVGEKSVRHVTPAIVTARYHTEPC